MASVWQQSYDRHASGYASELDPTLVRAVGRVLELARARPGIRLLDVATGTGTIARAAAARGASVVALDASAGMLEVARTLSPQIDLCLGDACAVPFGDGEFDVVTCGLSISHFADRDKALKEVLRVLRRGGKFVASAWADGSSTPAGAVAAILDRYAAAGDDLDEETWSTGRRGADVLRNAGFTNVSVETGSFRGEFAHAEDALAWATSWPLTAARLARLDPGHKEQFFSEARAALTATTPSWSFAFNFYVAQRPLT